MRPRLILAQIPTRSRRYTKAALEEPECVRDVVNREETVVDAVDEEDLDAEPGFDEEFDAAREAEAEAAGGWAC